MRYAIIAAIAAACLLATPAEARRSYEAPVQFFCGDRYCQTRSEPRFRGYRAKARRIAKGAFISRTPPLPRSRPPQIDAAPVSRSLPGVLSSFNPPAFAVCGRNLLAGYRAEVARLASIEPARPGFVSVRTASGRRAVVAAAFADRFLGFIRDLEASGYRIRELGGYAYRFIDRRFTGGRKTLSQHARGRAIDINQLGRNSVSVRMDRQQVSRMASRWGLRSGGDWRNPDLGHFEVIGPRRRPIRLAAR